MTSSETPYRFENADGYSVISFQSELNDSQWADFEKVGNDLLGRLAAMKKPAFIVDLSALNYMGSAMVALIVRLWKSVKDRNGKMVVVNNNEMVFEVLKLAGLHDVWTIVETREMALKQLGKRSTSGGGQGQGGGTGLLALGSIGVLGGLAGIGLMFAGVELGHPKAPLLITMGCSALGLIAGAMSSSGQSGGRKSFSVAILIVSVAILLVGGVLMKPEAKAATKKSAAGDGSKNQEPKSSAGKKREKDDDQNSKEKSSPAKDGKQTGKDENKKSADATKDAGNKNSKADKKADKKTNKKSGLNLKKLFKSKSGN